MKILCIGRNYADHAKEMNAEVPSEPLFFLKPDTALNREKYLYYPDFTNDLHHEVEIVVKISKTGKCIEEQFASNYYSEIGLGIDFTARDIQKQCKEKGLPWEKAKAFDNSAVISNEFIPVNTLNLNDLNFSLKINGNTVQKGNTANMLFSINQLIVHLSKFFTLKTGDLIYTGTPEGVGPVKKGDKINGFINDKELFSVEVR